MDEGQAAVGPQSRVEEQRQTWRSRKVFHWAHQGGAREGPSNTLWAMQEARRHHASGLELDVHVTKDGCVVVAHDDSLRRMTGASGTIANSRLEDLSALDAAYHWVPGKVDARHLEPGETWELRGRGLRIPTLEEVMDEFPNVPLNLELKSRKAAAALAKLLASRPLEDLIVVSFRDTWIRKFRRLAPGVAVAPGRLTILLFWLASRFGWAPTMRAYTALQVPIRLGPITVTDSRLMAQAEKRQLAVHVWTVDDERDMEHALSLGVHGIMTDRPSVLDAVLDRTKKRWPPPAEPEATPGADGDAPTKELRLALALNGGISLAVWMGSVVDELLRFVRRAGPYGKALAGVTPRIDVMAGASAGGLNGVFLALGLVYQHGNLELLRDLWVDTGSFEKLFRSPYDKRPVSLLKGDEYFLVELQKALMTLVERGTAAENNTVPIDLRLAVTSLTGEPRAFADDYGGVMADRHHDVELHFRRDDRGHDDFGPAGEPVSDPIRRIQRLAKAGRSSASFPGAFEPSFCTVVRPDGDGLFVADEHAAGFRHDRFLVDGGVLVNLPIGPVLRGIFSQPAEGPVDRVLAAVVPDPSSSQDSCPDEPADMPGMASVISQSVIAIPRRQSVSRFLAEIDEHNQSVTVRRVERAELIVALRAACKDLGRSLYPAYRAGRIAGSIAQFESDLCSKAGSRWPGGPPVSRRAAAEILHGANSRLNFPWVPPPVANDDAPLPLTGWGVSAVTRSSGLLIFLIDYLRELFDVAGRLKANVHEVRRDAEWVRSIDSRLAYDVILGTDQPPLSQRKRLSDSFKASLIGRTEACLAAWPGDPSKRPQLDECMRALAGVLHELVAALPAVPPAVRPDGIALGDWKQRLNLAGALRDSLVGVSEEEALRWLLSLEVIENAFRGFEELPDQLVKVIQIDSTKPLAPGVDPGARRSAAEKLAGVKLGHFGGFLKRSWRANDWMWGRLDAATALGSILGDEAVTQEAQYAVLRTELGNVAREARRDIEEGGEPGFGRSFADGYFAAEAAAPGGVIDDNKLSALLGYCRIGEESLGDEAGSDLATRTMVGGLVSTTNVFVGANPPVLKNAARLVRSLSLVIWAMVRTTGQRRRLSAALAGTVFGLGLAGVTADLYTGVDLGVLAVPSWLIFLAGALLALVRAVAVVLPLVLIGIAPGLLTALPGKPWDWWPRAWVWPRLDWTWVPPVAFVVAWLVIGVLREWRFTRSIRLWARGQRALAVAEAGHLRDLLLGSRRECPGPARLPYDAVVLATVIVIVKSVHVGVVDDIGVGGTLLRQGCLAVLAVGFVAWRLSGLRRVMAALGLIGAGTGEWRRGISLGWTLAPVALLAAVFTGIAIGPGEVHWPGWAAIEPVVGIGLGEELLFRGAVFALALRRSLFHALAISSASFGLWHLVDAFEDLKDAWAWQADTLFVLGTVGLMTLVGWFVFAPLRLRSRAIWAPALFHGIWNLGLISLEEGPVNKAVGALCVAATLTGVVLVLIFWARADRRRRGIP